MTVLRRLSPDPTLVVSELHLAITMRWLYRFLCLILRCGPLPPHLSVIMDGNRRYASSHQLPSLSGHLLGYSSLLSLLQWSRHLGLQSLTLYAWSIDNYNRSREEVRYLMQLFCDKMHEMSGRGREMRREGVELRLLGNMNLLPDEVQRVIQEVRQRARREREEEEETGVDAASEAGGGNSGKSKEEQLAAGQAAEEEWIARQADRLRQRQQQHVTHMDEDTTQPASSTARQTSSMPTSHSSAPAASDPPAAGHKPPTAFVNLCVAYTSQQEMTDAAARIARALQQHPPDHNQPADPTAATLHPMDLSASLFHSCLYTASLPLPFPSLLLRTSGEHRLSDFLLCQLPSALLCWSDKYWPQLSFFDVLGCVLAWQRWVRQGGGKAGEEVKQERVVREEWRREWLKQRGGENDGPASEVEAEEWMRCSEQRIQRFVQSMPTTTVV